MAANAQHVVNSSTYLVIDAKSELSRKHKCYGKTVFFVNTEQLVSFVLGFHFGFDLL